MGTRETKNDPKHHANGRGKREEAKRSDAGENAASAVKGKMPKPKQNFRRYTTPFDRGKKGPVGISPNRTKGGGEKNGEIISKIGLQPT